MLLGAVTYNVLKDWDLQTVVQQLEAARFEAVELRTGHKHRVEPSLTAAERESVKRRLQKTKIRLLSFGSTCEFHSPGVEVRTQTIETGKRWIDLSHDTGPSGVKVGPIGLPKEVSKEVTIGRIAECLREPS